MSYGDTYKSEKDIGNSNAENREHEDTLFAKRTMPLPTNQQIRVEYSGDDAIKVGYAPKGLAEGTDGWILWNISYVSNDPVSKKTAYGNWSNRNSETYE